jgi:hypothetical protein
MPDSTRRRLAAFVSPLLLFIWLYWPGTRPDVSTGETIGQLLCAYVMFFAAYGLTELVVANLNARNAFARLGFTFLFAAILSLSIRLGLMFSETRPVSGTFIRELVNGFGDAFWCAAAITLYRGWVRDRPKSFENHSARH